LFIRQCLIFLVMNQSAHKNMITYFERYHEVIEYAYHAYQAHHVLEMFLKDTSQNKQYFQLATVSCQQR